MDRELLIASTEEGWGAASLSENRIVLPQLLDWNAAAAVFFLKLL